MRKKLKGPPRPLDKIGFRLKGWTANKISAIQQKRKSKKVAAE